MSTAPTTRTRRRRRTALAAGLAGVLSLATGLTMIAAAGSAAAAGKPDPGGNNGTVKVAGIGDLDQVPDNEPHLGCTFTVQWYGYRLPAGDVGPIQADVSFALQHPTTGAGYSLTVASGDTTPSFTPLSSSGAGSGLDHEEVYTLALRGTAQPQQGYHVKLTVHTPHSKGSDVKHKVFWVGPCTVPSPSSSGSVSSSVSPSPSGSVSPSVSPSPSPSGSVSPSVSPSGSVSSSVSPSGSVSPSPSPSVSPSETVSPSASVRPSRSPTVAGTETVAVAPTAQGTGPGGGATGLPTVVEAGQGGPRDGATAMLVAGRSLTAVGAVLLALAGALALGRKPGDHQA